MTAAYCPPASTLTPARVVVRVFLPFAAGYFLSYLYRTIKAVLSPYLVAELGLNAADLGLLTSVYFISFGAFQLPLGLLLDRFGPRRVEASLLLLAAVGAVLFARSHSAGELILGRALIGLGVSGCLMASFKAFVVWFPTARLPAVNGWVLAVAGIDGHFPQSAVLADRTGQRAVAGFVSVDPGSVGGAVAA